MNSSIFIVACLCWILVERQVAYWAIIAAIGFNIETPFPFLTHRHVYFIASSLLFALTIVFSFFQTILPVWIALLCVLLMQSLIRSFSRKRACTKYRQIVTTNLLEDAKKNGKDTSIYEKSLRETDEEILERARTKTNLGIT